MWTLRTRSGAEAAVSETGGVFDVDKLNWLNGEYIRSLDEADLTARIVAHLQREDLLGDEPTEGQLAALTEATPLVQTRMATLAECGPMLGFLLVDGRDLEVEDESVASLKDDAPAVLDASLTALEPLQEWTSEPIEANRSGEHQHDRQRQADLQGGDCGDCGRRIELH